MEHDSDNWSISTPEVRQGRPNIKTIRVGSKPPFIGPQNKPVTRMEPLPELFKKYKVGRHAEQHEKAENDEKAAHAADDDEEFDENAGEEEEEYNDTYHHQASNVTPPPRDPQAKLVFDEQAEQEDDAISKVSTTSSVKANVHIQSSCEISHNAVIALLRSDTFPLCPDDIIAASSINYKKYCEIVENLIKATEDYPNVTSLQVMKQSVSNSVHTPKPFTQNVNTMLSAHPTTPEIQQAVRRIITELETLFKRVNIKEDVFEVIIQYDFPLKSVSKLIRSMFPQILKIAKQFIQNQSNPDAGLEMKYAEIDARSYKEMKEYQSERQRRLDVLHEKKQRTKAKGKLTLAVETEIMSQQMEVEKTFHSQIQTLSLVVDREKAAVKYEWKLSNVAVGPYELQQMHQTLKSWELAAAILPDLIELCATLQGTVCASLKNHFSAIPKLNEVQARLNNGVMLKSGRQVNQPFQNNDLPGIVQNLRTYYLKPTINDFIQSIIKILEYVNNTPNFEAGVAFAEVCRDEWNQTGMWDMYMNPDVFFSMIPILGWKNHHDRQKYVQKLLQKMEEIEEGVLRNTTTADAGPLFIEIKNMARLQAAAMTDTRSSPYNSGKSHHNNQQKKVQFKHVRVDDVGAPHMAYAANTGTNSSASVQSKEQPQMPTKRLFNTPVSKQEFSDYVERKLNIWVKNKKSAEEVPYCAHKSACYFCYPHHQNNTRQAHVPRCCNTVCTKCNLTGHITEDCLQTTRGTRDVLK